MRTVSKSIWKIVIYAFLLVIAVFAVLPYGCRFGNRFFRAGRTASMVSSLYFIGLLLLCIAGMVNGTYVSFLYAQF